MSGKPTRIYYLYWKSHEGLAREKGIPADGHEEFYSLMATFLQKNNGTLIQEKHIIYMESGMVPFPPTDLKQGDGLELFHQDVSDEELEIAGRLFVRR